MARCGSVNSTKASEPVCASTRAGAPGWLWRIFTWASTASPARQWADPIYFAHSEAAAEKVAVLSHHHAILCRVEGNHVERRAHRHAQSFALAHGEVLNALVLAQHASVSGDHLARRRFRLALLLGQVSVDELAIASRGHKANLLTIRLLRHGQAPGASEGAHFLLGHSSQGKLGVRQLLLRQSKEEVGLIFRTIDAAQELVTAGLWVATDARVMAGGDALRADLPRRA